jgi:RNA polymerase sigma factor (sigma-70 family)
MTRDADHTALVVAAQAGDNRARDELIAAYLPLIYNIVGRALSGHADVDDVVQETLLRVVRDLPGLRSPESFRSWLVAIALRQISTHRNRQRAAADRTTVLGEVDQLPDGSTDLEDTAILRVYESQQRRQVVEASRWLDPDHRTLLSLWWQEYAGWLSRGEIAAVTRMSIAHVGVRLQRMREQLELGRAIVAALEADPRCQQLNATIAGWDGQRTSVWRKRMARHIRGCAVCTAQTAGQVPTERLLLSVAPLAVPVGFIATLAGKGLLAGTSAGTAGLAAAHAAAGAGASGGGLHTSLIGKLIHVVTAHPLAALATSAVIVGGTAATYAARPEPAHHRAPEIVAATSAKPTPIPAVTKTSAKPSPSPSAVTGTIPLGVWSLESVDQPGQYLTYSGDYAALGGVSASSSKQDRQQATFTVVQGLADKRCVTFRAADGRYLRHYELRLILSAQDSSQLFREDATFCPRPGSVVGSLSLQSYNYIYLYLRHRDGGIWIDVSDFTKAWADQTSFITRRPWA